jgi:hypothetical protein
MLRLAKRDGHPARIRQDVVRAGPTVCDELVANPAREGKVSDPVAVDVPELAPTETKLDPSEPVPLERHALPRSDHCSDPRARTTGLLCHLLLAFQINTEDRTAGRDFSGNCEG